VIHRPEQRLGWWKQDADAIPVPQIKTYYPYTQLTTDGILKPDITATVKVMEV